MKIVEYKQQYWGTAVSRLFAAIYPEWEAEMLNKIAYDEQNPRHVITLLALQAGKPIGQINVFKTGLDAQLCNVGYHVHPDWQQQGIGSSLLTHLLQLPNKLADGFVIQTTEDNHASQKLARKFGFQPASPALLNTYQTQLKSLQMERGVCLHLA